MPALTVTADSDSAATLEYRTYFDRHYTRIEGDPYPDQQRAAADFVESIASVAARSRVLDLGCGTGWLSLELARRGHHVLGVDESQRLLETADRNAASQKDARVSFAQADLTSFSSPDCADVVLLWGGVLGYGNINTDRKIVSNALASTTPGGTLVVSLFDSAFFLENSSHSCTFDADTQSLRVRAQGSGVAFTIDLRTCEDVLGWIAHSCESLSVHRWHAMPHGSQDRPNSNEALSRHLVISARRTNAPTPEGG